MMHISPVTRVRPIPGGYRPDRSIIRPVASGPQGERTGDDAGTYDRPPERGWAEVARRAPDGYDARGAAYGLARHVNTLA